MYVESRATAHARLALRSDATVRVTVRPRDVLFEPAAVPRAAAGLLFLPGAPVDPIAYAPVARVIAARGYPTAIVFLPRRGLVSAESGGLATRAGEAMRALGAGRWVIAGHSRAGRFYHCWSAVEVRPRSRTPHRGRAGRDCAIGWIPRPSGSVTERSAGAKTGNVSAPPLPALSHRNLTPRSHRRQDFVRPMGDAFARMAESKADPC
jgi:hypothetical protein